MTTPTFTRIPHTDISALTIVTLEDGRHLDVVVDDNARVSLVLWSADGRTAEADTEHTSTWSSIDAVLPRAEWPREIYAGQHHPKHDTTPEIRAAIDAELAIYSDDDE